jgi:cell fate regulator YaaT (PSP1 superfamily)
MSVGREACGAGMSEEPETSGDERGDGDAPRTHGPAEGGAAPHRGRYVVDVRYGSLPVAGRATTTRDSIQRSAPCILRTNRGTELGIALTAPAPAGEEIGQTVGHILRQASARDLERQRRIEDEIEPEEMSYCRQKISERGLRMRLTAVEHIWGGERIVFYFTAERRVDFRALVRDLAWHFHTRIELRQIGARDEARLLAEFEHCGRPLCCKTFLTELAPVTMRMAKLQRMTLDPQKISGRCGRLKCCLRFEYPVYKELRRGLPNRGMRVTVGDAEGEVVSTDILRQRVTVKLADGETANVPVTDLRPPCPARSPDRAGGGGGPSARDEK